MIDWVMFSPEDIYHSANFKLDNLGFSVNAAADLNNILGADFPVDVFHLPTHIFTRIRKTEKEFTVPIMQWSIFVIN